MLNLFNDCILRSDFPAKVRCRCDVSSMSYQSGRWEAGCGLAVPPKQPQQEKWSWSWSTGNKKSNNLSATSGRLSRATLQHDHATLCTGDHSPSPLQRSTQRPWYATHTASCGPHKDHAVCCTYSFMWGFRQFSFKGWENNPIFY